MLHFMDVILIVHEYWIFSSDAELLNSKLYVFVYDLSACLYCILATDFIFIDFLELYIYIYIYIYIFVLAANNCLFVCPMYYLLCNI